MTAKKTSWLKRVVRWEYKHRLIPHFIVACILSFLVAKVLHSMGSPNDILYLYGITVTAVVCVTFTVSFAYYKDPAIAGRAYVAANPELSMPLVSCLVSVWNEKDIIEQCVQSLVGQTYINKEIIIVDDASTDGTGQLLDKLAKKYKFKVIHLRKNTGKKSGLARAVLQSKGDILAFTDSDSVWAPDAIATIVPIFLRYPKVAAVSGHTRAMNADKNLLTRIQDSWYEGQFSIRKAFESVFGSVTCVSGPLAVFRKEAIYNYMPAWENDSFLGQPFRFATDRTLTGYVLGCKRIDKELKQRYTDSPFMEVDYPPKDWKIVYCKSARAMTEVPDTFKRMLRQQIRWKKSFIRNTFFTGRFYWRRPFLPALIYYLHIMFVVFGPLVAFRHLIYLPLHGNVFSMFLYLAGIAFVGLMFGLAFKLEEPDSRRWMYRPLMSLLSTLVLSWLIFYSTATIRKMVWHRG